MLVCLPRSTKEMRWLFLAMCPWCSQKTLKLVILAGFTAKYLRLLTNLLWKEVCSATFYEMQFFIIFMCLSYVYLKLLWMCEESLCNSIEFPNEQFVKYTITYECITFMWIIIVRNIHSVPSWISLCKWKFWSTWLQSFPRWKKVRCL